MFDVFARVFQGMSAWTGFDDVITVICYAGQVLGFPDGTMAAGGVGG